MAYTNDDFADAIELVGDSGSIAPLHYDGIGDPASSESGEDVDGAGETLWWFWTASSDGDLIVTTDGSPADGGGSHGLDTQIAVFEGGLTGGDLIDRNDDGGGDLTGGYSYNSYLRVPVLSGHTYQVQVDQYGSGQAGTIHLSWELVAALPPPPPPTAMTPGVSYLVNSHDNDESIPLVRRSTAGVPPASLSDPQVGPSLGDNPPQTRGCYDPTRNHFAGLGDGVVVVDGDTLALVDVFPLTVVSGVAIPIGVTYDPADDRYYVMAREFSGAGPGYVWRLVGMRASDGGDVTDVEVSGSGRSNGANLGWICERPDGNPGVAALDLTFDGSGNAFYYVSLIDPDGTVHDRTMLPIDPANDFNSYTGVAIAHPRGTDYLAVLYYPIAWDSTMPYGGTWRAGTWLSEWTTFGTDPSLTMGSPYSPIGLLPGPSPYMGGSITPDPLQDEVLWYGSFLASYTSGSSVYYLVFKIDSSDGSHTTTDIGHWIYPDYTLTQILIAGGKTGTATRVPLRHVGRPDVSRQSPRAHVDGSRQVGRIP